MVMVRYDTWGYKEDKRRLIGIKEVLPTNRNKDIK